MSDKEELKNFVSVILKLLAEKDYIELEKRSKGVRLNAPLCRRLRIAGRGRLSSLRPSRRIDNFSVIFVFALP
jgi:hypothetical protein